MLLHLSLYKMLLSSLTLFILESLNRIKKFLKLPLLTIQHMTSLLNSLKHYILSCGHYQDVASIAASDKLKDLAFTRKYLYFKLLLHADNQYNSFRLINEEGKSVFVKFHWKPLQGLCSLVWVNIDTSCKEPDIFY